MKIFGLQLALCLTAIIALSNRSEVVGQDDCADCGPTGVKICCPTAETKKVEKTVYSVEEKEICVPRFRWPWQKCQEPKCGYVRTINVLTKDKEKSEKCGYKWEIEAADECASGSCATGSCAIGSRKLVPRPRPKLSAKERYFSGQYGSKLWGHSIGNCDDGGCAIMPSE